MSKLFEEITFGNVTLKNRLAVARKDYNDAAQAYNAKIKSFPTVLVARMMGFQERSYFKADPQAQKAP